MEVSQNSMNVIFGLVPVSVSGIIGLPALFDFFIYLFFLYTVRKIELSISMCICFDYIEFSYIA